MANIPDLQQYVREGGVSADQVSLAIANNDLLQIRLMYSQAVQANAALEAQIMDLRIMLGAVLLQLSPPYFVSDSSVAEISSGYNMHCVEHTNTTEGAIIEEGFLLDITKRVDKPGVDEVKLEKE